MAKVIQGNFGPKVPKTGSKNYDGAAPPEVLLDRHGVPVEPQGAPAAVQRDVDAAPPPDPEAASMQKVGVRAPIQGMPEQILKAMGLLQGALAGDLAVIVIAVRPADTGADFYTAIHGDPTDLRNARDHLDGVISRAYSRAGI